MSQSGHHAIVFGASGISGIPLTRSLLVNAAYCRVTGLASRPLSLPDATWKALEIDPSSPKLHLVSGLDLSQSSAEVKAFLKVHVKDVQTVTHVFFVAYKEVAQDLDEQARVNIDFLRHAVEAIRELAADSLQFVVLQTGGKHYGVEFQDKIKLNAPLKEETPRLPEPYAKRMFYYGQVDVLAELSMGQRWTWAEVRPDVIVGTVPRGNFMNAAGGLAIYLSIKSLLEPGSTIPYPGNEVGYRLRHNDTDDDLLARFEIALALEATSNETATDKLSRRAYNIANGDVVTWADKWPALCSYFGLESAPPSPDGNYESIPDYVSRNRSRFLQVARDKGLHADVEGTVNSSAPALTFIDAILSFGTQDRHYDLANARELVGFTETINSVKSYTTQFERLRAIGSIP